jgi:predicted metal-dependent hydrolase
MQPAPEPLRVGVHLFNAGEFFECHEVLEDLWREERGPIRELYQGILQVGVGFYHLGRGNHRGAVNLLGYGIARLEKVPKDAHGLDVAALLLAARHARYQLVEGGPERMAEVRPFPIRWLPRSPSAAT